VSRGSLLPQLARLHRKGLGDLASLLESQNRSHTFARHLIELSQREHAAVIRELEALSDTDTDPRRRQRLAAATDRCRNLDRTLALLIDERRQQWHRNGEATRAMMDGFSHTLEELNATLIDKDLLERHSEVLEQVILSYERLSHWQEFVAEILTKFRALFPFQFFFIAFAEEHALSLHLYHAANASPEVVAYARERFSREMLQHLGLPEDAAVNVDEHWVGPDQGEEPVSREAVDMITVGVPKHTPRLDGVVGMAFGADQTLSPQEESTIRSILSVMVMVVGSSKALSRTLEDLEYYAVRDPLTGLYNRRHFNEVLETERDRAHRHGHEFTVLLLDVDDFKDINDTFGHPAGDRALQDLARTIRGRTRGDDVVARIGGDEFALILPETNGEGGRVLAETLRQTIREMVFPATGSQGFHLTVSAGLVAYPADAATFTELMVQVDEALYQAKERGKDEACIPPGHEPGSEVRTRRLHAERFREALREHRIRPYYHALLDARTGEPTGFEVLARLVEPGGETLPAGQFIEAIERYGLSRDLDRSILEQSLRTVAEGPAGPPRLFLNLSAQEIQHRGILGYAEALCDRLGLPPSSVVFELLEREAIEDLSGMRRFLDELRDKGFAFALDDFGSGYNSFHYLRELRFEYVKIDGAFVRNVLRSRVDYVLVENLIRLCQDLGMATIAEFVESEEVMAAVRAMGVDYLQGFHISLPTPEPVRPPVPAAFA
jgi:diguanylate cyclase (GGDEF)-like protein